MPTLVALAWPGLFLSLGWNFLEFGLDPPGGGGLVWGWLVCAVVFALMGGLPLLAMAGPVFRQFRRTGHEVPPAAVVVPTKTKLRELRAAPRASAGFERSTPPGSPPPDRHEPLVDALERLGALHRSGALSDREFEDAKRRVTRGER